MKRKWIKFISTFVIVMIVGSNLVNVTNAFAAETETVSCTETGNNQSNDPTTDKNLINEEVVHVKNLEEAKNLSLQPMKPKIQNSLSNQRSNKSQYTMSDLNRMSYNEMVNTISGLKWNQIVDLFKYNEDARQFYGNTNRMDYLINSLKNKGNTFTAEDNKGIPTVIEVLRAGFYLGYYNDGLKELKERSYHDKCIPAIIAIQKNPNFKLGTEIQSEVVQATASLIGNSSCNPEIVNNFNPIFDQFDKDLDYYLKDNIAPGAIYAILEGVKYDIDNYVYNNDNNYSNTMWTKKIDKFIEKISKWALMGNINSTNEWLINNCVADISVLGKLYSDDKEGLRVLTEAMKKYDSKTEAYIEALTSISESYDNKDYYGTTIDSDKIKKDIFEKYVSKEYKFDNGKIVIKAGDKVEENKIKKLYWASKEVQAQFFRNLGSDKALEQGNADDVLTIVIYNNPKEYKMNRVLKGLDVNNGGMYIEGDGTFYTYERSVNESIYTLEELFRHEFTHYLQGRYLVPGEWGRGELYRNGRLTWLEEGGAEFFAGSTRTNGILPRQSVASNIKNTTENNWYTINKTMHSQYGNFDFYHYAFALQNFMYNKDATKLYSLMNAVKNNDVKAYDDLVRAYSEDPNLENSYKEYMRELAKEYDNLTTPLVAEDYLYNHDSKDANEIYNDIQSVIKLDNINKEEEESQFFKTFKLSGKFNAGKSQDELTDKKNMDKKLNDTLNELNKCKWSGYKTVTAYMTEYKVDENNDVIWNVVFSGLLDDGEFQAPNRKPVCNINGPYEAMEKNEIKFTSKDSYDDDGKIVEYLWDFGDGNTSNEENPIHKYDKSGKYTVKLTIKDDKGEIDTKETIAQINKEIIKSEDEYEAESNNKFEEANLYMKANAKMIANLNEDDKDIFSFEVAEDCTIDIDVKNDKNAGINWIVYSENDTKNYVAYPNESRGELSGSFKAKKGKYYIVFYKYDNKVAPYSFTINGEIKEQSNIKSQSETENNDTFKNANLLNFNTLIKGKLESSDNKDIYYFDVKNEREVEISLEKKSSNLGATWLLYGENDLNNYISYVKNENENIGWTKETLKPGRYYVQVYKYSGQGEYNLSIK